MRSQITTPCWRQLNALGNPDGFFDSPFSSPKRPGAPKPKPLTPKHGLGRAAPAEWLLDAVGPKSIFDDTPAPESSPVRRHLKGTRHPRKKKVGDWSYISASKRPDEQVKPISIIRFEPVQQVPGEQGFSMVDLLYGNFVEMEGETDIVLVGCKTIEIYIRFEVHHSMVAYPCCLWSKDFAAPRSDIARWICKLMARYCKSMGIEDQFYNLRLTGFENLIDDVWMPGIVVMEGGPQGEEGASGSK